MNFSLCPNPSAQMVPQNHIDLVLFLLFEEKTWDLTQSSDEGRIEIMKCFLMNIVHGVPSCWEWMLLNSIFLWLASQLGTWLQWFIPNLVILLLRIVNCLEMYICAIIKSFLFVTFYDFHLLCIYLYIFLRFDYYVFYVNG